MKTNKKRIIYVIIGLLLVATYVVANNNYKKNQQKKEQELVTQYVQCLKDNFTQRYYCAEKLESNYYYLDSLLEEYGYKYEQVGYDLYVKEAK